MNGTKTAALIDTGCITTLLSPKLTCGYSRIRTVLKAVDRTEVKCSGTRQTEKELGGKRLITKVIIVEHIINHIDIIIGMDFICELRALTVKNGDVTFGETHCDVAA